jgi:signal transduction histidine kinase
MVLVGSQRRVSTEARQVTACEEERRRLRRDLHDTLGPALAGLSRGLEAARNLLTHDVKEADALLAQLRDLTQDTVVDIRRLAYELRPPELDDLGLLSAIREQAAKHTLLSRAEGSDVHGKSVDFSVETPEHLPPLPAAVEVAAYRITQEAMTNVVRHAQARSCRIRLALDQASSVLQVQIVDDGVGLPADRRAGVGLASMRERAAELGGTCVIEPVPSGGTRVVARLPLPASKESSWTMPAYS